MNNNRLTQQDQPDTIQDLFSQRNLRCTKQRRALYQALVEDRSHPTADQLFRRVGPRVSGLSLATVYNTLEAFCDVGLAQKLPGSPGICGGSARYDAYVENHLHIRCTRTGQVSDVPANLSQRILNMIPGEALRELEETLGFHVTHVKIELLGEATHATPSPAAIPAQA